MPMTAKPQSNRKVALKTDMPFRLPDPPFDDSIPIGLETLHGGRTWYVIVEGVDLHQADLFMKPGEQDWWIRNCGSAGVVHINGVPVDDEQILAPGDKLSLGNIELVLSDDGRELRIPHETEGVRIQVDGLTRRTLKNKIILEDVSFVVEPDKSGKGKFVGVLGPSGCGKSSLIQAIAGMTPVTGGKILVNGVSLTDDPKALESFRRMCVYLPQNVDNTFHDDFTVREEMSVFRQLRTLEDCDGYAADCNNLKSLGFTPPEGIMNTPVKDISGGERRRVAIARALALRPQIMLFDEPTAGLDTVSEHDVMERMRSLAHDDNKMVFCVTHALTRARDFDHILLMRPGGELVFSGTPCEALAKVGEVDLDDMEEWERLYKTLKRDSKEGDEVWGGYEKPTLDETGHDMPLSGSDLRSPMVFQRIWGYLKSFGLTFCRRYFLSILPFAILVGLAFLLWLACRDGYIWGEEQVNFKSDCYVFAFCGCLTMFWMGLLGSVGTLVSERVPRRCLERLDGVPLYAYLPAKGAWHAAECLVQTMIFAGCLAFCVRTGYPSGELLTGCELWFKLTSPLLICSLSGMLIGMAVSALFLSETWAVKVVPIFAIAQLLLSRVVVDVETASGAIVRITDMMPCRWPIDWMSKLLWKGRYEMFSESAESWFALMYWAIGCVVLIAAFQWWNERRWQGR